MVLLPLANDAFLKTANNFLYSIDQTELATNNHMFCVFKYLDVLIAIKFL